MKLNLYAPLLCMALLAPVHAATPIDETRAVDADAVIEVHNVAGSIRVRGSERADVRVTGSVGEGAKGLRIEGDRRRLKISIEHPRGGGWSGWWGGGNQAASTLELEVPRGVELKVEAVSARVDVVGVDGRRVELQSVSGGVNFAGAPDDLRIESVSGSIDAEVRDVREAALESVSGRITLTGSITERLSAEAVSGRLRLSPDGELRAVKASVVSGDIDLNARLARGGRLEAESLSGELNVTLPRATSARVRASSFSGSIRSDVGTVESETFGPGSSLRATLGDGEGEVRLESFSGRLHLRLE